MDFKASSQAARLRALRIALGKTRSQIADAAGIDRTSWGRFEDAKRPITTEHLIRLCRATGVSADYVLLGKADGMPEEFRIRLLRAERASGSELDG